MHKNLSVHNVCNCVTTNRALGIVHTGIPYVLDSLLLFLQESDFVFCGCQFGGQHVIARRWCKDAGHCGDSSSLRGFIRQLEGI